MGLMSKLFSPATGGAFSLPLGAYHACRFIHMFRRPVVWMSRLEGRRIVQENPVDRPIYVTGLARSGTTISLEMLSRHPQTATHRYYHMVNPYWAYWWSRIINFLPLPEEDLVERIHKDGVMVNRDSPEALEEPLWTYFFKHLHDETRSNILDATTSNPRFERYYRAHMAKLVASQGASRYLTKNNYDVTRLEYLQKISPDARFLLFVRNPVNHIASVMKQNRLFTQMGSDARRTLKMTQIIGHHEFGDQRICINVGNSDEIRRIRALWEEGRAVRGWAMYWASLYNHVARRLSDDPLLQDAVLVVRYEDLCADSERVIDEICAHTQLDADQFAPLREEYAQRLKPPTYYKTSFSDGELADISELASDAAAQFGYREADDAVRFDPRPATELH